MPFNEDRTIFRVSPTVANCSKKRPTASIPLTAERLIKNGTLKSIEVYDCIEDKLYTLDPIESLSYLNPYFKRYFVLEYKRVPEPSNKWVELTPDEVRLLRNLMGRIA